MARLGKMIMLSRSTGDGHNAGYGTRIEHEPPSRRSSGHEMENRGSGVYGAYMGLESPPSYVQNNYKIRRDERVYNAADFDVEDRFRDRRGREHYDNGRYAPRSAYDEPESRRDSRGRYARSESEHDSPMGNVTPFVPPVYESPMRSNMNPIGFVAGGMREAGHGYRQDAGYMPRSEMEHRTSHMESGGASSRPDKLTREMAEDWMEGLQNEDGTKGPHWTMEQTRQVMSQRKIDCDPVEFWAAMNMIYSDYSKVLQKHGAGERVDIYADMAKAFLDDKDAAPGKMAMYYECIVK